MTEGGTNELRTLFFYFFFLSAEGFNNQRKKIKKNDRREYRFSQEVTAGATHKQT